MSDTFLSSTLKQQMLSKHFYCHFKRKIVAIVLWHLMKQRSWTIIDRLSRSKFLIDTLGRSSKTTSIRCWLLNLMITAYIYTYTKSHNSYLQQSFIVIINFMSTISFTGNVVLKFFRFLCFLNLLILLSYYTFSFTKSRKQ